MNNTLLDYHKENMRFNLDKILGEIEVLGDDEQIPLQGVPGIDDLTYGTGGFMKLEHPEHMFTKNNFDLPYTNSIIEKLGMYNSRVMRLKPRSCYTYHVDFQRRIHIPVITNRDCFFIIEDKVERLKGEGDYYIVDTTKYHTFVNASVYHRIHIVGGFHEDGIK